MPGRHHWPEVFRRLIGLLCLLALAAAGCTAKKPAAVPTATASPAVSATPSSPATSPTPGPSASPVAASPSSGAPPPAGATARSITFISLTQAWVLAAAPGPLVLHTTDRGKHWSVVGPITEGSAGAREIRFADAANGWAFDPGLYATHDGGAHWAAVPMQGNVLALEISGGTAWAVVSACAAQSGACASPTQLLRTPVGADQWAPVLAPLPPSTSQAQLVVHGSAVFVLADANPPFLLASTGGALAARNNPCPTDLTPSALAGSSAVNVDVLCSGNGAAGSSSKQVMASSDAGQTFHALAAAPLQGQPLALAAGSPTTIALAAASGASEIYRTTAADTSWATVLTFPDGGAGWQDLGFTDATHAVVIHETGPATGGSPTGAVYLSDDAGATWHTTPLTG